MEEILNSPEAVSGIIAVASILVLWLVNWASKKWMKAELSPEGKEITRGLVSKGIRWLISKVKKNK